ncbi:MAG: hypothetical protein R3B45_05085 [Bdellovibrionota bacterium]
MHFLAKNQYSSARVEVQRAARYLQTQYGAGRRFDDPSLRLWLASLWAVLGDWNNARIDLKVAFQLDNTQKWIKDLIKLEKPPKHIYLGMLGAGADIKWHAKSDVNAIRGLKNLEFFSKSSPSQIKLSMGENTKKVIKVIPTERWYYRHQDRNQVIKDVIDNSVYSGQAAGVAVGAGTLYTTGIIAGIGVFGLGLGAGSAVAWHLIQAATSSDGVYGALLLGAGITYGGYKAGTAIYEEGKDSSYELLEHGLGQANNYRYVRFLPEYIFMDYTDKASEDTPLLIVEKVDRKIEPFLTVSSKDNATQVHYFHHSGKKDPELKVDESIRHWYDGRLTWVFSSRPKLGDNEVCRKLGLEWSAPNSYELRKAVANGLMSEKKNQYIAKALKEVDRIWLDAVVEKEVVDGKTINVTKCLSSSLLKAASIETSCLNLNIVACVKEGRID